MTIYKRNYKTSLEPSEIHKWVSEKKHTNKDGLLHLPQYDTINEYGKFTIKENSNLHRLPLPKAIVKYENEATQTAINLQVKHPILHIIIYAIITFGIPTLLLYPDIIPVGGDEHFKEVNKIITAGSSVFLMLIISYLSIVFPAHQIVNFLKKELHLQYVD